MNMTKYLNTYYGTGWVYDRTTAAWVNPDGRRVIKVLIDKEWKYIFRMEIYIQRSKWSQQIHRPN